MSSVETVAKLRAATGAGIVDCRDALLANDHNIERATDWLRKKGIDAARGRAAQRTPNGLVSAYVDGPVATLAELRCQTDFTTRTGAFCEAVELLAVATKSLADAVKDDLLRLRYPPLDRLGPTIDDYLKHIAARTGETLDIGKLVKIGDADDEEIEAFFYIHDLAPNARAGKMAAVLRLRHDAAPGSDEHREVASLGRRLAMQAVATSPIAVDEHRLPTAIADRERAVHRAVAEEANVPEDRVEQVVSGKMAKWSKAVCLMSQAFIQDTSVTVRDVVQAVSQKAESPVDVVDFAMVRLGD